MFNYGAIYEARVKAEAGAPVYFYLGTYWDKEHTYKDLPVRGMPIGSFSSWSIYMESLIVGCEHALDQAYWFWISFELYMLY